jgi:putative toxin-antitoxin system antitoxin component (TIGR02293 family)
MSRNETELERITARAEEALGDAERARRWINAPNRALSGRRPADLVTDEEGVQRLERVLGRIEHGVYS